MWHGTLQRYWASQHPAAVTGTLTNKPFLFIGLIFVLPVLCI